MPVRPHFLGTIVLDQLRTGTGKVHLRQIIDGQQRLTTLQLALAAARDLCTRCGEVRYAKAFEKLTVNEVPLSDEPDDVFKVWPTNADRDDFRSVMKAGSSASIRKMDHAAADDEWLIPNAYLYFHDAIDGWLGATGTEAFHKRLDVLYQVMRDDLHLVVIDLESQDDAQEIFETLNALGTPLLPADLVKNYLFHLAERQNEDTRKLYRRCWERFDDERGYWRKEIRQGRLKRPRLDLFLYHFLTLIVRQDIQVPKLFSTYREFVQKSEEKSAAKHMDIFREYSDVYKSFDEFKPDSREALFFYRLDQLDTTTVFPILLEVVKRLGAPEHADERQRILADLESFLVRRAVCELTAKNYNKLMVELLKELREVSADNIRGYLLRQEAEVSRWPNDEEFKIAWMGIDFYKRLSKPKGRMILEALEAALHSEKTERIHIEGKLTIEHLLPREWGKHWPLASPGGEMDAEKLTRHRNALVHRIGNLSLLTKALNPAVSNGPWDKKRKEILRHSVLNLNRTLPDVWDEAAIEARSEMLFNIAVKIWPHP
jgi:hypothetical protein